MMESRREKGREYPFILEATSKDLAERGVDQEGIFRISGNSREVNDLRARIENGHDIVLSDYSPHTVACLLKMWLRELPEPLMTFELYDAFNQTTEGRTEEESVEYLKEIVQRLPAVNRVSLHRLLTLLHQIAQNSAVNLMPSSNLSIVFTPALLRKSNEANLIGRSSVDPIILMIDHPTEIFGEFVEKVPQSQAQVSLEELSSVLSTESPSDADNSVPMVDYDDGLSSGMTLSLRDIVKQGYLSKEHEFLTGYWDKRWIIIKKGWLYNLKAPKDKKGEVLCLAGAALCPSKRKKPFSFAIRVANSSGQPSDGSSGGGSGGGAGGGAGSGVNAAAAAAGSYTDLLFAAESDAEMKAWMEAFRVCLSN